MKKEHLRDLVVLVDENDNELGTMSKIEAHQKGALHRAISVLIFNSKGELLIQQRAEKKYHWPLIWANSCCSHPMLGESYSEAAARRVREELGINPKLHFLFKFIYKATDAQTGLIEHELDYVFRGEYNGEVPFCRNEIAQIEWITMPKLLDDIGNNPNKYAFWFKEILKKGRNFL